MNNKHGFTLIELLITIGLIALLMIIFMPTLLNMGKNVKEENYNSKVTLIEKAAINFVEENKNSIKGNSNLCISVEELIKRGFLVSDGKTETYIADPTSNGKYIDGYVLISYSYENNDWKANSEYVGNSSTCAVVSPIVDAYSSKYDIENGVQPVGQIQINDNVSYTKSLAVTLKITDTNSVATTMCVSVNNSNCLAWETYKTTKSFTLDSTGGNGIKNVYLWLANESGEYTGPVSDSIIYDSINPTIAFSPNGNATTQKSQSTTVTISDTNLDTSNLKYVWSTVNTTSAISGTLMSRSQTITKDTGTGSFYLCVYGADLAGNYYNVCSSAFSLNNNAPTVAFSPNGNTSSGTSKSTVVTLSTTGTINIRKYLITTVNNSSASGGTTMSSNSQTINITGSPGTYYVCIYATDTLGNATNTCSNAFTLTASPPVISFSPNGNTSSGMSKSTTISITTTGTISTRKYLITTVNNSNASGGTTMTANSQTVSITGSIGTYYVCVYALDTLGNSTNTCSSAFILSSTPPSISFSPSSSTGSGTYKSTTATISSSLTISTKKYLWSTYSGASASSGINMSSNSQSIGISSPGTWYLCVYAVDSSGVSANVCSGAFYVSNVVVTTPSIYSSQFNNTGLWQTSHIVFSCYASDGIASMSVSSGAGFLSYYSHIKTGNTEKAMVGMNASYSTSFSVSISCTTNSGGSSSSTYSYNTLGTFNGSYISQFSYPSCYAGSSSYSCTYNYFGASYYCTNSAGVACGDSQYNGTYFSPIPGGIYNINPETTEVCISAYGYYVNCCM